MFALQDFAIPGVKIPRLGALLVCATLFLGGCSKAPSSPPPDAPWVESKPATSESGPSETAAADALRKSIETDSKGNIRFIKFAKTNGRSDSQMYTMEYEVEIEFAADGLWMSAGNRPDSPASFRFLTDESPGFAGTVVKKGQRTKAYGAMRFQKMENGWRSLD